MLSGLCSTAIPFSCSGPGPLLPGQLLPLSGPRDAAAAFPFAGVINNTAEHVLQTWLVSQAATDETLPSIPPTGVS